MAIETVVIGGEKFFIHQTNPSYGVDEIGNPHYLGLDYLAIDLEILPPHVNKEGNIYYSHNSNNYIEDEFIAFCRIELSEDKSPISVIHKNGDKFDNTPENLDFVYENRMY